MEQKELIFNLTNQGKTPIEIQSVLAEEYGKHAYSRTTVYKWAAKLGYSAENNDYRHGPMMDEQLCVRIE